MAPSEKLKRYKYYLECVSRKRAIFSCPHCGLAGLLPKNFEEHCARAHDFDKKRRCVWCWGETSWMSREKSENAVHLLKCFRTFIAALVEKKSTDAKTTTTSSLPTPSITSTTTTNVSYKVLPLDDAMCPERCVFDHDETYILKHLPTEALESFAQLEVESLPRLRLPYTDERVNLAASYVLKYVETRETRDWFHVMVKAVAFESFLKAVVEAEDRCRLLEFSCWCDGGRYEKPEHRQHRHMVAVCSPKGIFESEIWNRVDADDRPVPNYLCKGTRKIQSPMHLVNTLGYLSKRTSRCEFSLSKKKKEKPLNKNHFYIFKSLPSKYRLPLVVVWDEGLAKLMYQQMFQNVSLESVVRHPLSRAKSQWRQKIDDFYDLPRGIVLPVDRRYVPTDRETPHYLYLLNGRKLHFEFRPDSRQSRSCSEEEWLDMQVRGGNRFYENLGGEWWVPRKDDQEKLNLVVPRENRIREMETEIEDLKRESTRQKASIESLNCESIRQKALIESLQCESIRQKALIVDLEKKLNTYTSNTPNTTTKTTSTTTTAATNGNFNIDHVDRVIINNNYK